MGDIVDEDESSEPDNINHLIMGKVTWCKMDKKPGDEHFLRFTNLIIDNPKSFVEVVSAFIDDSLIQLFIDQSSPCHTQNVRQWKVSPKLLKWSDITP
jgi:hypothetical protein